MYLTGNTHYKAAFDIQPRVFKDGYNRWSEIIREIRDWISLKHQGSWIKFNYKDPPFNKGVYIGGNWQHDSNSKIHVHICASDQNFDKIAEYWALRYEHPDTEFQFRTWTTDIGLHYFSNENICRLRIRVYNRLIQGYIGIEPEAPKSSVPKLVQNILARKKWKCTCGNTELKIDPSSVLPGEGQNIVDNLILNAERKIPIILVSKHYENDEFLISPNELSRDVAGSANVLMTNCSDTDNEITYYIGDELRCTNGTIRIYFPDDNFSEGCSRKHRFFSFYKINDTEKFNIRQQIIDGLVKRGRCWLEESVQCIEDIEKYNRSLRIKQLSEKSRTIGADNQDLQELAQAYADENDELKNEINRLNEDVEGKDGEINNLYTKLYDYERIRKDYNNLKADVYQKNVLLANLDNLPASISECLYKITNMFPEHVVLDDEGLAINSAENAKFGDINSSWKALYHIATTLYNQYFYHEDKSTKEIERIYKEKTGFDLTHVEGKLTKQDNKLMSTRLRKYNGSEYQVIPHVKVSCNNKSLRIYFYAIASEQKILIGHCGDHLVTYGTRRRKEE